MTIKVFEAFAGVGSQRMALRDLNISHEVVAISEIDKYAIQSYEAIHGPTNNVGDITKLTTDDIPDHDLFTYSFPCQDISVAGKQNGLDEDSDTRSSLLWHCRKIIESKKPKYLLLENVKNLVGKRHKYNFDKWLDWLSSQGYTNYWQVINAKDYGIPQNRDRVFVVSVLGGGESFEFPKPVELTKRLRDVLEKEVDEKFYLSEELQKRFEVGNISGWNHEEMSQVYADKGISPTLNTMQGGNRQPKILEKGGNTNPSGRGMNGDVYNSDGLSPTLTTNKGEGNKILIKNATKKGYLEATDGDGIDLGYPDSKTRRGRVQPQISHTLTTSDNLGVLELPAIAASRGRNPDNPSDRTPGNYVEQRLEVNKKGVSNTLTSVQKDNYVVEANGIYTNDSPAYHRGPLNGLSRTIKAGNHDAGVTDGYRIRKLTPLECWRLMGFSDEDFYKAQAVCSNTQLYKQAGNSIVKDVLMAIFKQMFIKESDSK